MGLATTPGIVRWGQKRRSEAPGVRRSEAVVFTHLDKSEGWALTQQLYIKKKKKKVLH